jgi:hypothetical protein
MQQRFKVGGEFAQAYVIAHEVGHHVQNLLGISDKVDKAQAQPVRDRRQRAVGAAGTAGRLLRRRLGLPHQPAKQILEQGDVESALATATRSATTPCSASRAARSCRIRSPTAVGAARALVQAWAGDGRRGAVQYLRGAPALIASE